MRFQETNLKDEAVKAEATKVANYLKANHLGANRVITNGALSKALEMPDPGSGGRAGMENSSHLSRLLLKARELGHPVVSDRTGIFYAEFFEEIEAGRDHMFACALKYEHNALTLERAAQGLPSRKVAA